LNFESNHIVKESDLIKGCVEKNRAMQKLLYDRYAPKMYTVCLRYCKNAEDAQDLLQEGFIKIFRNIDNYRGDGSFEGWMRRIFVNTSIAHFRKVVNVSIPPEDQELNIEDKSVTALDNFAERDIISLVQELSPGYRQVFNLYVIEGYSHKDISEMLGIGEGTSKSQLARAKSMLRSMIEEKKMIN